MLIAEMVQLRVAASSEAAKAAEDETTRRQLHRLEVRFDRLIWEQLQIKECLLLFVRVWLEHNPPLEPDLEESLAMSAEARFERFLDILGATLTNPTRHTDLDARAGLDVAQNVLDEDGADERRQSADRDGEDVEEDVDQSAEETGAPS